MYKLFKIFLALERDKEFIKPWKCDQLWCFRGEGNRTNYDVSYETGISMKTLEFLSFKFIVLMVSLISHEICKLDGSIYSTFLHWMSRLYRLDVKRGNCHLAYLSYSSLNWRRLTPDWKIGQWRPRFFSRYKFLRPWNCQFFMGGNFRAPGCPCVFRLSMAARLHSARLYHGRHNNWIKSIFTWHVHCSIRFCAPCSPWVRPWVRFFAPALRFNSSCAPEISLKTAQFSSLGLTSYYFCQIVL